MNETHTYPADAIDGNKKGGAQMNRKNILLCSTVVCLCVCSGCATLISESEYSVSITSNPSGAGIKVADEKGRILHEGTTPAIVPLKAGAGYFQAQHYNVTFVGPDNRTQTVPIEVGLDHWYLFGNFFFGGLVGYLVVDPITGAMWELKDLHVNLGSPGTAQLPAKHELRVVALDQVPIHLRSRMIPIEKH